MNTLVVTIAGNSGTGKTTLIEQLLRELSRRRYKVAAVKHCPHGFDLDVKGKDSQRFMQAGASGVFLISPGRVGLLEDVEPTPGLKSIAERYFPSFDIVLGEGFSKDKEVVKILVLKKGISDYVQSPQDDILALVSDFEIEANKPVFKPDDVSGIADFIERLLVRESRTRSSVTLIINKKPVPLKAFVQRVIKKVIIGIIDTLKRKDEKLKQIDVIIKLEDGDGKSDSSA